MNHTNANNSLKDIYFTPREWDVLSCMARGSITSKDIAKLLQTSPKTVETHISHILTKTQCHSRHHLTDFIRSSDPEKNLEQFYVEHFDSKKESSYMKKTAAVLSLWTQKNIILGAAGFFLLSYLALAATKYWSEPDVVIRSPTVLPKNQSTFIERTNLIDKLKRTLLPGSIVALIGPGGIGKTTLSRLYATHSKIKIVWEINASQETSLISSLRSLAKNLAQDDPSRKELQAITQQKELSLNSLVNFIYSTLNKQSSWLLIFDNVDDLSLCRRFLPQIPCEKGHIIITTRDQNIQNLAFISSSIHIEELSLDEAYDLFVRLFPSHGESEKTKAFIAKLPPFPLDISLGAHYIRDTHIDFDQYLQRLEAHQPTFHLHEKKLWQEISDYPQTRYALISLTLEKILEINPQYLGLLNIIVAINSQDIPVDLLRHTDCKDIVESFIHDLRKFSLLTHEKNTHGHHSFSLHRSTQEVLKHSLAAMGGEYDVNKIARVLISCAQSTLKKENDSFMTQRLIPHFEAIAKVSADKLLRLNLGMLYYHAGQFSLARKILEDILLIPDSTPTDQTFLDGLIYLGNTYKELKESQLAEDTLQRAINICRKHSANDPDKVSQLLISLSYVQKRLGSFAKAEEFCLQSINLCEKDSKNPHYFSVASAHTALCVIHREQGHYKQAKEHINKSLALYEQHMPQRQIDYAHAIRILGQVCSDQGLYQEAQNHYLKSLNILIENDQKNHPKVLWLYAQLGGIFRKLGGTEQAHTYLNQAEHHNLFTSTPVVMGITYCERAHLYIQQKEYEKAAEEARKSEDVYKRLYGNQHVKYGRALNLIGYTLLHQGHLDQAEDCMLQVTELFNEKKSHFLYQSLDYLSEIYRRRLCLSTPAYESTLRQKSLDYINQAIVAAEQYFPSDSVHLTHLNQQKISIEKTQLGNDPHKSSIKRKQ